MTHIFERIMVRCPYARARRLVHEDAVRITPPIPFVLQFEHAHDPLRFDERLHVHWMSKDGGPFPEFSGEIVLRAEPNVDGAILELSGDYVPPFGRAGLAFDLFLGTKIAAATAKSVLRKMADAIEQEAPKNR